MANRILPGYMMPVGDKHEVIVDHDGPASYVNTGISLTSGEVMNAIDLGLGGFEIVDPSTLSNDGLYFVQIQPTNASTNSSNIGNAIPNVRIHWINAVTLAEVPNGTNLSGSSIRLQIRAV